MEEVEGERKIEREEEGRGKREEEEKGGREHLSVSQEPSL